jgi:hypothetical protein
MHIFTKRPVVRAEAGGGRRGVVVLYKRMRLLAMNPALRFAQGGASDEMQLVLSQKMPEYTPRPDRRGMLLKN